MTCVVEQCDSPALERQTRCRACHNACNREYYAKNREHILAQMRRNPEARWEYNLKRWYGITADDYYRMLDEQGGCCAICGTDTPGSVRLKKFHVDHDHVTKVVRGLLCHCCNPMIGQAKDDPRILRRAITYLERSSQ